MGSGEENRSAELIDPGPPWTDEELRAAVETYLEMLGLEMRGIPYVKADFRRSLMGKSLAARSGGSIEYRMRNISAVLDRLKLRWIEGYKPANHFGQSLEVRLQEIVTRAIRPKVANEKRRVSDICLDVSAVMGVKAVFNSISSLVLCFNPGDREPSNVSYYSKAARVARLATSSPFVIAIGGGRKAHASAAGRVVSIARVGTVYGPTAALLNDGSESKRLAQWPVAVSLHEVWHLVGMPRLIEDLRLPDRTVLAGAQDGVIRPLEKLQELWEAIKDWPIEQAPLRPLANFYDSGIPHLAYPTLPGLPPTMGADEGAEIYKRQRQAERDRKLARRVKELNRRKFGKFTCEACRYKTDDSAMLDAHHIRPLAGNVERHTLPEHLLVLCPTCHRKAHRKSKLDPYSIEELRTWVADGRP